MGDVALCLPVIKAALELNPELQITFVTREEFCFLFREIPRLTFFAVNFKKNYKGLLGLLKLSQELKKLSPFDYICDLHQVMRTQILNTLFFNTKIFKIKKDRNEKKKFLKNPDLKVLKHTTERYLEVFKEIGLKMPGSVKELLSFGYDIDDSTEKTKQLLHRLEGEVLIGIAPFARHFTKIWPYEYLQELIKKLEKTNIKILLFGGPDDEKKLRPLELLSPNVVCLAGEYSLEEELSLMKKLKLIITMDSANMHFASLCKTPVISLWGGTHPGMGFYPIDPTAKIIQIPAGQLDCRPCALFGLPSCPKGHFDCMKRIKPDRIQAEIFEILARNK